MALVHLKLYALASPDTYHAGLVRLPIVAQSPLCCESRDIIFDILSKSPSRKAVNNQDSRLKWCCDGN